MLRGKLDLTILDAPELQVVDPATPYSLSFKRVVMAREEGRRHVDRLQRCVCVFLECVHAVVCGAAGCACQRGHPKYARPRTPA
jgi:hypothetical protein